MRLNNPVVLKTIISITEYKQLSEESRRQYWQINKKKFRLLSDIAEKNPEHFQNAYCYAQVKQLDYHNKCNIFTDLIDYMETIAEHKNLKLNDLDTEFHKNIRKYKSKRQVQSGVHKVEQHQNTSESNPVVSS
jgi:hypothetical protein